MPRARRAKHWCWTLNNPTDDEEQHLCDAYDAGGIVYLCFGREIGESGTPHLQGYTIFEAPIGFTTVKNRLGSARLHIEVSRGSPEQNKNYCSKDGDFEEFGQLPESSQGRRTDLESYYQWSDEFAQEHNRPPTTPEAARAHPAVITKYPRVVQISRLRFEGPPLEEGTPQQWQQNLADDLADAPCSRSIKFFVDYEGGKGKSWFVRWYLSQFPGQTQFLSIGKRDDIAHVVKIQTTVFLVDVPRGQMEFLQYGVLEQLKNRLVFSPKYNSETKTLLATPHVVVFSNEDPDMEKMTEDRYDIYHI